MSYDIDDYADAMKYWAQQMLQGAMTPSVFLTAFPPPKNWNWFERTFCKNLIRRTEYLERKIPEKVVTWNKFASIPIKEDKHETVLHQPNCRSKKSKRH